MFPTVPIEGNRTGDVTGRAVKPRVETNDIETACRLSRKIDRRFDGVAAGNQKYRLLQGARQDLSKLLMQAEARHVEHRVAGMQQALHGRRNPLYHPRMLMAECGPHLPGLEI